MALLIRTGMTLLSSTSLIVRGTFKRSAAGMMKRLATECSRPIATKVEMGNQTPMSLPTSKIVGCSGKEDSKADHPVAQNSLDNGLS
jgi:hypothetical protein